MFIEDTVALPGRPPMILLNEGWETANPLKPTPPIDDTPPPAPPNPPGPAAAAIVAVIAKLIAAAKCASDLPSIDESSRRDLLLAAGDRALGLRHAVRASTKISELRHRVDCLVPVNPSDKHRRLAEPRQLAHLQAGGRHLAAHAALACVAQTSAAQILEREDAVVAVDPLHADGVAPYFVQAFYLRSL